MTEELSAQRLADLDRKYPELRGIRQFPKKRVDTRKHRVRIDDKVERQMLAAQIISYAIEIVRLRPDAAQIRIGSVDRSHIAREKR